MSETKPGQCFGLSAIPVVQASVANMNDSAPRKNTYDMGVIGSTASILTITLTGDSDGYFENGVNFTIPAFSSASRFAQGYSWNFLGIAAVDITGLVLEVWNDVDPGKSQLHARCSGSTAANFIGKLAAGPYHLDISGYLSGNPAQNGQYSVVLQALPVPEPTAFALLLAGLGWMKWSARRRKFA